MYTAVILQPESAGAVKKLLASLLFSQSLDALRARQNALAGRQSGFLQVRVFSGKRLGVVVAAKLDTLAS